MAYYNGMGHRALESIELAVLRSFEAVSGGEFAFLGERRNAVLSRLPLFTERLRQLGLSNRLDGMVTPFETLSPDIRLPDCARHMGCFVPPPSSPARELSVAMVHGSFDPFHLGHLFMGLDAVCDGSCDFAVFMPNADRENGGPTEKPSKSPFSWRARTLLSGGVDDFYPALRYSSFGSRGGTVESHLRLLLANRPRLADLDRFVLWIVLGSDIVRRPHFASWTNDTYREVLAGLALPNVEIRFRVVERAGFPLLREAMDTLDYAWISVPEVSLASSTAIRDDPVAAVWLYPGGVLALESYLLYAK